MDNQTVDWVALDKAIHTGDPNGLSGETLLQYKRVGPATPQTDIQPEDQESEEFWATMREIERVSGEAAERLGWDTPEHDQWIRDFNALSGIPVSTAPEPKKRAPRKKA